MDGLFTSSIDGVIDGVRLINSGKHLDSAIALFKFYFSEEEDGDIQEMCLGEFIQGGKKMPVVILGCVDENDELQSATLVLERKLPRVGLQILEIVWFGSWSKGKGHGSQLFQGLMKACSLLRVDAVITTTTNGSLPFWLTRPNIRIAETIIRQAKRAPLDYPVTRGFKLSAAPTSTVMERFYLEPLIRNRKGKICNEFEGKPYHYGVDASNHVWYLLNPKLQMKSRIFNK